MKCNTTEQYVVVFPVGNAEKINNGRAIGVANNGRQASAESLVFVLQAQNIVNYLLCDSCV